MNPDTTSFPISKRCLLLVAGVALVVAVALFVWKQWGKEPHTAEDRPLTVEQAYPGLDLSDPAPSFEVLRYAMDTGGDERTRKMAIVWLDNLALLNQPPSHELESWLMGMLKANGHPGWDTEYRLWLFNSAFNILHLGRDQEAFTHYLHHLMQHDDVRTMRIYAIQHLGLQREGGRLTGALADEVRASLHQFATKGDGSVAGMAVARLVEWDGKENPADPAVLTQAVKIAADPERPVDVRVTALHAAGSQALPMARELALDATQPVILRKSAIACIGSHGGPEDFPNLGTLSNENFRIAQASQPAIRKIRDRLTNPDPPLLVPF